MNTLVIFLILLLSIPFSPIQGLAASFFEGKTLRIVVGYSPGGGYDTYARLIARHMRKYIPGKPSIIVENMPGAGSLVCANYIYKVAKPDGLTIGNFNGGLFMNQVLEQPGIEFDARKFLFVGAPSKDGSVYAFSRKSGITSMEKWLSAKTPVKMGGLAAGSHVPDNVIRILRAAIGVPVQLVSGYKGTADIRLAIEQGEIAGSSWGWSSLRATWHKALESGDVVVVLQAVPKPYSDLSSVPLAINYAKTDEARKLIEIGIYKPDTFQRAYVLPPNTPKDRAQIIIKAFSATLQDRELLAEAEKARLDINYVSAEELKEAVNALFNLEKPLLAKLREILYK